MAMEAWARSSITIVLALHLIYLPGTFCLTLNPTETCVLAMEGEYAEIACSYVLDKQNVSINFRASGSIVWEYKASYTSKTALVLDYQRSDHSVKWGQGYKGIATIPNATSDSSCTLVLQPVAIEHRGTYTCTLYTPEGKVLRKGTDTKVLVGVIKYEEYASNVQIILLVFVGMLLAYSLATSALIISFWFKTRFPHRSSGSAPEDPHPSSSREPDAAPMYASLNPATPQMYSDLTDLPPKQPRSHQPIATTKAIKKVELQMEVKNTGLYENINVMKSKKLPAQTVEF